jgi:hypothetical protein
MLLANFANLRLKGLPRIQGGIGGYIHYFNKLNMKVETGHKA